MSEQHELEWIRSTLAGNTADFGRLIAKYQKPLFNLAFRLTGAREDAEDIVQAVFVKAFENLDSFNPSYRFFSWIYRMTINEAVNFLSIRRRHTDAETDTVSTDRSPSEQYELKQLSEQIDAALGLLSLDYRVVVVLRHFLDLSYGEMALILEIPEKTVKSRLYSARQILCAHLKQKGVFTNA